MVEWFPAFNLLARLVAYISILALFLLIIIIILKKIVSITGQERTVGEITASENNPILQQKAMSFTYGTYDQDLESGNCSTTDNNRSSGSTSEEIYDEKVCVICYDEERNCFFVPCGHCATCYVCARRISDEDIKLCPVCRRFIGKVRKLFPSMKNNAGQNC